MLLSKKKKKKRCDQNSDVHVEMCYDVIYIL